jgi:transcriptional regulator of acetoin/glycerol metabolism
MMTDGGEIREEHLPPDLARRPAPSLAETTAASRRQIEREAIRDALRRTRGNRAQAARLLRISRSSLYNRLRELKIDD